MNTENTKLVAVCRCGAQVEIADDAHLPLGPLSTSDPSAIRRLVELRAAGWEIHGSAGRALEVLVRCPKCRHTAAQFDERIPT